MCRYCVFCITVRCCGRRYLSRMRLARANVWRDAEQNVACRGIGLDVPARPGARRGTAGGVPGAGACAPRNRARRTNVADVAPRKRARCTTSVEVAPRNCGWCTGATEPTSNNRPRHTDAAEPTPKNRSRCTNFKHPAPRKTSWCTAAFRASSSERYTRPTFSVHTRQHRYAPGLFSARAPTSRRRTPASPSASQHR